MEETKMASKTAVTFGALLKYHRRKIDRTKTWVAQQVGVDPSYVSIIEDKGFLPRREIAKALGDLFRCPNKFLLAAGYAPQEIADTLLRSCKMNEVYITKVSTKEVSLQVEDFIGWPG